MQLEIQPEESNKTPIWQCFACEMISESEKRFPLGCLFGDGQGHLHHIVERGLPLLCGGDGAADQ